MKYPDSIERSAELLRLALPHMSRQNTALHPLSYALWYEHVAGRNAALSAVLNAAIERGDKLDEATTHDLYSRHVAEVDEHTAQRVSHGFQRVLTGMAESAAQAGDQTERFGSSLNRFSAQLSTDAGLALGDVLDSTRRMQDAVEQLNQRLVDSQAEIELLRDEVARARSEALHDALTGLANRRAFDQALAHSLAQDEAPCLLMLDIDHFKRVNDHYGHVFGDQVIRAVAQVMKAHVKGQDTAARVGGEEFAVVLPATPVGGARALAERLRATIAAARIRRTGQDASHERVTVSLGVASHVRGETASQFFARTDQALYASKAGGRDRVTLAA